MVETAHILNHATPRSLIILDEVGRGTSTYDGISIAWACVEYLHAGSEKSGAKVLFATHYFELTELEEKLSGVRNAHVTAREWGDQVVFLHKVEAGPADRAYGIHVAKLAGVPKTVLERAQILLQTLEKHQAPISLKDAQPFLPLTSSGPDPKLQARVDAFEKALREIEINSLTPLEAIVKLAALKKQFLTHPSSPADSSRGSTMMDSPLTTAGNDDPGRIE
jgi:DNA mismatch repair protein MutS